VAGVVQIDKLGMTILLARGGRATLELQRLDSEVDTAGEFGELTCCDQGVAQCRLQMAVAILSHSM
jgi:hypothetical protein